jgi:cystathionine beta-lyase
MDISYIINELGEEREQYFNAVSPPVIQSTNFSFKTVASMREDLKREGEVPFYTRGHNPTTAILQRKLAALEGAEDALVFASGSAAVAAAVMSNVQQGDHIVCVQKPYSWTNKLLNNYLPRFGVQATMVDGTSAENYEKAIRPNTRILFLESPNSFTFELQDIDAVVAIARRHGLLTIMDNSYATPRNQSPIRMGVDLGVHAATKYLCGHSDAVAGVVCGTREMMKKIFTSDFMTIGGIASPFNSWLLLRGLRTLPMRMDYIARSTGKIVEYLQNHPRVSRVYYPFLPSHPQYELARKQMRQGGGLFTVELRAGTPAEVEQFCDRLKRFLIATSWGGYESLVYPACVFVDSANYQSADLNWRLVRFYIGLEETEVLLTDLAQALA